MQEAQGDPYAIRFGVSPVFNAPQVSVQLITTVNGYYAPSTFRCVKVKAVNSLRKDPDGSTFWHCETYLDDGQVHGVMIKPCPPGKTMKFIKGLLRGGYPGLVQMHYTASRNSGPIEDGLCMRMYCMNLWEFCHRPRNLSPLGILQQLSVACDLLRGVSSIHSLRDENGECLIHFAIRPQHFLCDDRGRFFLTGFDEMTAAGQRQALYKDRCAISSSLRYPGSCPPEMQACAMLGMVEQQLQASPGLLTGQYSSPQVVASLVEEAREIAHQPWTQALDLFGLGCCLLFLLTPPHHWPTHAFGILLEFFPYPGPLLFRSDYSMLQATLDAIHSRAKPPGVRNSDLPQEIKIVIESLLETNGQMRMPAANALNMLCRVQEEVLVPGNVLNAKTAIRNPLQCPSSKCDRPIPSSVPLSTSVPGNFGQYESAQPLIVRGQAALDPPLVQRHSPKQLARQIRKSKVSPASKLSNKRKRHESARATPASSSPRVTRAISRLRAADGSSVTASQNEVSQGSFIPAAQRSPPEPSFDSVESAVLT